MIRNLLDLQRPMPQIDSFGVVLDEDQETTPIGYRWLRTFCASKAVLPQCSMFVTPNLSAAKFYHVSQNVLSSTDIPKIDNELGNMIWAIENEGIELQILKVSMLNANVVLATQLKGAIEPFVIPDRFGKFGFSTNIGGAQALIFRIVLLMSTLLLDPEKYV